MTKKKESRIRAKAGEESNVKDAEKGKKAEEPKDTAGAAEEQPQDEDEGEKDLAAELKTSNERYLRLMAEFDNYKKRTSREYQRMVESANEKIINAMIDVRNTFELALKHGETSSDYQKLFEGVKLIFTKFDGVLSSHGLSAFAEIGEEFDPQMHDALMKTPHESIPEDHIAEIYEKGYRINERIIKHAKVIVSAGEPSQEEGACEEQDG